MSDEEAVKKYGSCLHLAGLGVVEEKDKVRVVHDGTHGVGVNNRIRVMDQVKSPTAGEIRALMREKYGRRFGLRQLLLMGDVSKAHRRVKVREQDWGYQACRLHPGKVWVNCVGTYGIGSAGYWWGRLASGMLVRLFHYLTSASGNQDMLLYSDDFLMTAGTKSEMKDLVAVLFLRVALGIPWKWKKFRGGF